MRLETVPRGASHLERRTMAMALVALYGAGGFLTLLSIVLPHPSQVNEAGALFNSVVAILSALVVWRFGHLLPLAGFQSLVALGTCLIALGIHFGGYSAAAPSYGLFYLWVVVYSFSFFSFQAAVIQAGAAAAAHLTVLIIDIRLATYITDWAITWGILFVTGLVVGWLSGQVRSLAETDSLTGLRNRRAWEAELTRELANSTRTSSAVSMILMDIDGLKAINDTQGHQAGDRLIKETAAAWSAALRSGDLLARLGGDEFGVLLTACALDGAHTTLARLHEATPTRFSAGCATWDHRETPEELMHRADLALYEDKRRGSVSSRT